MIKIIVTAENKVYKLNHNMIVTVNESTYINHDNRWQPIGKVAHVINLDNSTKVEDIEYLMEKLKK